MTGQTSSLARSVRLLSMVFTLAVIFCCASLTSSAEAPAPSQPTSTPNTPVQHTPALQFDRSRSFGEQVAMFGSKASELMQGMQTEMSSLMGWVEYLALVLMMVVIIGSGVREWHENNWEGRNLFWWFGRLAVCLLLFGSSVGIIDELYLTGKEIAEGGNHDSVLYKFYSDREALFSQSYEKVVDGSFKVTVKGQEFKVEPIDGAEAFLGVTKDREGAIRDITSKLDDSAYSLPRLFAILSIARGVMELGDVWLVVLAGLLMMTFKMTAPFMVVLAIDRKLSQRTVNAYIWGLIVLTLIWPSVSYFIRGLGYMAGNLAMSMGDQGQVFSFDDTTQKTLRFVDTQPVYTIGFGALMMLGTGLALWVSPFIAYSIAMGRVFEGVSQTASQYAASFVGAALELVTASTTARIARQAEIKQIEAGNEAEKERAGGEKRAADLGAQARLAQAVQGSKSQQIVSLSQVHAGLLSQRGMANAARDFQNGSIAAQYLQNTRLWTLERTRQVADQIVSARQQEAEVFAGAYQSLFGGASGVSPAARGTGGTPSPGGGPSAIPFPETGPTAPPAPGVGALAPGLLPIGVLAGGGMRLYGISRAVNDRAKVLDMYYSKGFDNIQLTQQDGSITRGHVDSAWESTLKLNKDMTDLNDSYALAQANVAKSSAAVAAGGVNRAYNLQLHTAHRVNDLELDANQARFDAQIKAADITRTAGMEAANLRVMQHVISQVASKISRDIEKGIEMRF